MTARAALNPCLSGRNKQLDHQVISLYSKGMTTREITTTIKEMYDVDISPTLVSHITDSVIEDVRQWQSRSLDGIYPVVFMNGIVVKVRDGHRIINKSIHIVPDINLQGRKELLVTLPAFPPLACLYTDLRSSFHPS